MAQQKDDKTQAYVYSGCKNEYKMQKENMPSTPNSIQNTDVNNPDFYNAVKNVIDIEQGRLSTSVTILQKLRIAAAEMEVEVAALYHNELWLEREKLRLSLKELLEKNTENSNN